MPPQSLGTAKAEDTFVFGFFDSKIDYRKRRAAYAVIIRENTFAAVRNVRGKHFLPGGGARAGEVGQETVHREIREELNCEATLLYCIGTATQFFYAASDDVHYQMEAVFFGATLETKNQTVSAGDEELVWLPLTEAQTKLFHASHAWAVVTASMT